MKSLSLSRPLIIMVIGLPGSGKSFFARQFSNMFMAPLVSTNFVRHSMNEESKYDANEDAVVNAITGNEVKELIKTGKSFIIDGGVNNRAARLSVERLANKHDYGCLTIWVQTDEPTSLSRSLKRKSSRLTDAYNSTMDIRTFKKYKQQFTNPTPTENTVVISGKHTYATQARIVLKKLVSPRDNVTIQRPQSNHGQKPEQHHDIQPRRYNVSIS